MRLSKEIYGKFAREIISADIKSPLRDVNHTLCRCFKQWLQTKIGCFRTGKPRVIWGHKATGPYL